MACTCDISIKEVIENTLTNPAKADLIIELAVSLSDDLQQKIIASLQKDEEIKSNNTLLNVKEAAVYIGVCRETLLRWVRSGDVACIKQGARWIRFEQNLLDEFIKNRSVNTYTKTEEEE